jgi:hypothetical protein
MTLTSKRFATRTPCATTKAKELEKAQTSLGRETAESSLVQQGGAGAGAGAGHEDLICIQ